MLVFSLLDFSFYLQRAGKLIGIHGDLEIKESQKDGRQAKRIVACPVVLKTLVDPVEW